MKRLIRSIFTLSAFTFIERVLGFFFKIYLSAKLGATSLGIYQVAFSFFMVLLTAITSGLPLVVSKRTAKCRAENALCEEYSISSASLIISLVSSCATIAVVLLLKDCIATLFADSLSMTLVLYMLPSLLFSSIYSSLRGNLWGRQKYTTVSVLELVEQIARIFACVVLFLLGFDKMISTAVSMSIACFISAAACAVAYFSLGGKLTRPRNEIKPLLKGSAPITLSRAASSVIASLTSIAVPYILISKGLSNDQAMYQYGYSVGMALPLLYIPLTFVGSLAFVTIPTLSRAIAAKNEKSVKMQIERSISVAIVAGGLFVPVFAAIGSPIGSFLYSNADAGNFLAFSAWLMIPIAVENITSSMMNSLELELKALAFYAIGSAAMFAFIFAFKPNFDIRMLAVGMGISFSLSSALNVVAMRKKVKFSVGFFALTLLKTVTLAIPAYFVTQWLYTILNIPEFFKIAICSCAGVAFMTAGCFVFGTLKIEYFFDKK